MLRQSLLDNFFTVKARKSDTHVVTSTKKLRDERKKKEHEDPGQCRITDFF